MKLCNTCANELQGWLAANPKSPGGMLSRLSDVVRETLASALPKPKPPKKANDVETAHP